MPARGEEHYIREQGFARLVLAKGNPLLDATASHTDGSALPPGA